MWKMSQKPYTHKQKMFALINKFSKVAGYKFNTFKSVVFMYTNNQ